MKFPQNARFVRVRHSVSKLLQDFGRDSIPWVDIEQLEQAGYRFRGRVYQIAECGDP